MRIPHVLAALAVATIAAASIAGPINPPQGPVSSTMKTMQHVEPRIPLGNSTTPGNADAVYIISEPGSYYLTGHVTGAAGRYGIVVQASGVTIDLNGFRLAGEPGSINGIDAALRTDLRITNGQITGWGERGISAGARTELSRVTVTGCALYGALVGADSVVRDSIFTGNGVGLNLGAGCTISGCVGSSNTSYGFSFGGPCSFSACTANANDATGFYGAAVGSGATIVGCSAEGNGGDGFAPYKDSVISGCAARANARHGFSTNSGAHISRCVSSLNAEHGFRISSESIISGCVADRNGDGAGIFVGGANNRVERNNVTRNDEGISAAAFGNFVMGNTASDNTTNYELVAGNVALVVLATSSGAISGFSGGTDPGATSPWANFSY